MFGSILLLGTPASRIRKVLMIWMEVMFRGLFQDASDSRASYAILRPTIPKICPFFFTFALNLVCLFVHFLSKCFISWRLRKIQVVFIFLVFCFPFSENAPCFYKYPVLIKRVLPKPLVACMTGCIMSYNNKCFPWTIISIVVIVFSWFVLFFSPWLVVVQFLHLFILFAKIDPYLGVNCCEVFINYDLQMEMLLFLAFGTWNSCASRVTVSQWHHELKIRSLVDFYDIFVLNMKCFSFGF